jgi:hypothetical protein
MPATASSPRTACSRTNRLAYRIAKGPEAVIIGAGGWTAFHAPLIQRLQPPAANRPAAALAVNTALTQALSGLNPPQLVLKKRRI